MDRLASSASLLSLGTPRSSWSRGSTAARRSPGGAIPEIDASYDGVNRAPLEALIQIVSRGNILMAEVLRLSAALPPGLRPEGPPHRCAPVLFDFQYLKDTEGHERRVEASQQLLALDEEYREAHRTALEDLYGLYEALLGYHDELIAFLEHIRTGAYIHSSLESLLLGPEGKQLVIEAVYLMGALLLALDQRIVGAARERSVVALYRLRGGAQAVGPNITRVISLCRSTGYNPSASKLPAGYPEEYLGRLALSQAAVRVIISRLRSDDVYNQIPHYPNPEHRSVALSQQAAYLYVILFYVPALLHKDAALMRVLVDKHYVDNWVLAWAPGLTADLAFEWDNYKAARGALGSVINPARAKQLAAAHGTAVPALRSQLAMFLAEGTLKEEYVLQNTVAVFECLRACNVTVQWLMLHAASRHRRLGTAVAAAAVPPKDLTSLILDTALLEFEVKRLYGALLDSREAKWQACRAAVVGGLEELAEHFSGGVPLTRRHADANLSAWFTQLVEQVEHLAYGSGAAGVVRQVMAALEQVEAYHAVEAFLQSRQYLADVRAQLSTMIHIDHVREELMGTLVTVSDFSYAWGLIDTYTPLVQAQVRAQPRTVLKLRCLFLKLRSMLEMPLLRISQTGAPQLEMVTQFYSSALLSYVRRVLQVVPATMLELLSGIVALQAEGGLAQLPTRLEKDQMHAYAQPEQRRRLAALTHRVAALAQGTLAMERTFMGVIELDPVQLLVEDIRAQLARRIGAECSGLAFSHAPPPPAWHALTAAPRTTLADLFGGPPSFSRELVGRGELDSKVAALGGKLAAYSRSFEYVQDFVNIPLQRIWQQDLADVIRRSIDQERQRYEASLSDASPAAAANPPVPAAPSASSSAAPSSFMGRLTGELLRLTDPLRTAYLPAACGWVDGEGIEVLGLAAVRRLRGGLGVQGLAGVDQLLGCRLTQALTAINSFCGAEASSGALGTLVRAFATTAGPPAVSTPENGPEAYTELGKVGGRTWGALGEALAAVGQMQLLRLCIALELRNTCKLGPSGVLTDALEALSGAAVTDALTKQQQHPEANGAAGKDPPRLPPALACMLDAAGLQDPREKIYAALQPTRELPLLLFLAVAALLPRYAVGGRSGLLERRVRRQTPDAAPLALGLATLLRHTHPSHTQAMMQYFGQYMRTYIQAATGATAQGVAAAGIDIALPQEVGLAAAFLESLVSLGGLPRGMMLQCVPPLIMDLWPATVRASAAA